MGFEYCRKCRKAYINGSSGYCLSCIEEMDESVKIIREYLEKHPGATVAEISKNTEVSKKDIVFLLRDDRLVLENADEGVITCDRCGKSIRSGRYCKECLSHMGTMFNSVSNELKAKQDELNGKNRGDKVNMRGNKMRISNRT